MLPQAQVKYNRNIDIPEYAYKIVNNPDSFWVITWLGKCFLFEERIHREIVITNITNQNYYFKDDESFKIFIPEEKTFSFPLGTYLDYSGKFLKYPKVVKNSKAIIEIKDIVIDPSKDYHTKYLFSKLNHTYFPIYREIQDGDFNNKDTTYSSAPFYLTRVGDIEIIIPNHVILSYYSTLCIYSIIYGTHQKGLFSKVTFNEEGIPVILYNSTYIREKEVSFISKFLLIENGDGIKKLHKIHANFYKNLQNRDKYDFRENVDKYYLDSEIPYKENVKFNLIGKMISSNKFLAFDIIDFELSSGNKKFDYDNCNIIDVSDHSSINEQMENSQPITSINAIMNNTSISLTSNSSNHNLGVKEIVNKDVKNKFSESPKVKKEPKQNQDNSYFTNQILSQCIQEFSDNSRNHNNQNLTTRVNQTANYASYIDYIQVIFSVVEELREENYEVNYIYIKRCDFENCSYPPTKLQDIGTLVLVSIVSGNYNYCLIVSTGQKRRMGLIRSNIPNMRFQEDEDEDETINDVLINMIFKYNLYWEGVKKTQELKQYHVDFIHSFNHIKGNTHDDSVKNLLGRLKEYL